MTIYERISRAQVQAMYHTAQGATSLFLGPAERYELEAAICRDLFFYNRQPGGNADAPLMQDGVTQYNGMTIRFLANDGLFAGTVYQPK